MMHNFHIDFHIGQLLFWLYESQYLGETLSNRIHLKCTFAEISPGKKDSTGSLLII